MVQFSHGTQPHYFMANRREKVEVVTDFLFLGSKITVDSDCSHEIRKEFFLGRKAMTHLDRMLKSRDITLLIMICMVKVFPVVACSCETWICSMLEQIYINNGYIII